MRLKQCHRLIKNVKWRQAMAVLLVGIALFDLTVVDMISPQLCESGSDVIAGISPAKRADARSGRNTAVKAIMTHQDSLPQEDSSPASTEEDCFCCCSHVLPVYSINQVTMDTMPRIDLPSIDTLPSAPPQN